MKCTIKCLVSMHELPLLGLYVLQEGTIQSKLHKPPLLLVLPVGERAIQYMEFRTHLEAHTSHMNWHVQTSNLSWHSGK